MGGGKENGGRDRESRWKNETKEMRNKKNSSNRRSVTRSISARCWIRKFIVALEEEKQAERKQEPVRNNRRILSVGTCSTLANTLSRLRPASFFMSSSDHVGSSRRVANS